MKKIYMLLLLAIPTLAIFSCGNDWLSVKPTDGGLAGGKLTLREAEASAYGLYNIMSEYHYYGARMTYYADVKGDDMQANGATKRVASAYGYAFSSDNAPTSWWYYPYKVINNANNILRVIDDIDTHNNTDLATKNHTKGQALMLRALAYFDICRVYGYPYEKDGGASWGACIIPKEELNPENNKPRRSTVKETYEQVIIPDLIEAIPLLKEKRTAALGQVTRLSAKLLLSRVYLYCKEWDKAFTYAKEVIDENEGNGFRLWTTEEYSSLGIWKTHDRVESLLELKFGVSDAQSNEHIAYLNFNDGYNDQILTNSFYEAWDPADVRKSTIVLGNADKKNTPETNPYGLQRYFTAKYSSPSSNPKEGSIIVMRLSEAFLNAAEASTFLTDAAKKALGVEYYNRIHERAGLTAKTSITLDDVLEERRFELYAEGHRMFDLLRHNKTIRRTGAGHLTELIQEQLGSVNLDLNNYRIIMPIPKYEINANPNIRDQQNPGWGTGN